ncbi:MAG: glycosyltransferase family 4 protein [Candidatus Eremiobacteraeota bacterium]|nr:glycosyltransferase family 4 protein [Candidatus Eremiobacteraeota bacterium]MBV8366004.1 glycosyltransferase family 4 protein [Candidatus Eremiobacteraeota bacterium]
MAVSDFTKREIVRLLGVDPARIHVIHQAAAPPLPLPAGSTATARRDARERYLLFVGEVEPRKDIATLLEAMQRLPTDLRATTKLIVVGRARGLPHAAGNGTQVELAGEIADDAQLAELYAGAAALAFPSRYEGFGLPVLEAMSYGTPVVASDAASIPEVGGDAALYFPCGDAAALSAALTRVLREPDLATSMRTAGIARARAFDEETRAAQTLAVLETAART